jgi:hypothetical protein
MNAFANRAIGGGLERESNYVNCKLRFGGIEGIISINAAYKLIMKYCHKDSKLNDSKFLAKVEASGWYNLIRKQIQFAMEVVEVLHDKSKNALIHCADGWDRTSVLCSLTQILLDPYYRTIEGFEVLIEKDWISFGHKFDDRSGFFRSHSDEAKERAPVFINFCD